MGIRGAEKLPCRSKSHANEKWNLTESGNQLSKDDEVLLNVWILLRTNRIENAHEIGLLIGPSKVAVAEVKALATGTIVAWDTSASPFSLA
jgi:hypothetical protein